LIIEALQQQLTSQQFSETAYYESGEVKLNRSMKFIFTVQN